MSAHQACKVLRRICAVVELPDGLAALVDTAVGPNKRSRKPLS
jgi:hypothetical protein